MATVAVTFAFLSDVQSFTANPGTSVTMAWDGANGNPVGCLSSSRAVKGNNGADSSWTRTLTYQTMGVPVGAIVTGVTAAAMESRCTAFTSAGAGNTSGAVTLQDGATIVTLSAQRAISGTDGAFVSTAGVDTTGLLKASSNSVVITIPNHLQNSNTTGSTVTLKQDQLTFTLTYFLPYADSIDNRPQPPALRQKVDHAAATMEGNSGIQAPLGLPLYQDTQYVPQPPVLQQKTNRAAGIMPTEPGNEAPFVYVAPAAPITYFFDQPTQPRYRRPGNGYIPIRLSLATAVFPGSVSWQIDPPMLPRPTNYRAAGFLPIEPGNEFTYIPPTAATGVWPPDPPQVTMRGRARSGYQPYRQSITTGSAPAAGSTQWWGEQTLFYKRAGLNVAGLSLRISLASPDQFIPLTFETNYFFNKPKKRLDPAPDKGEVSWPISVAAQPTQLDGYDQVTVQLRGSFSRRGAALRTTPLDQFPPLWVNWGWEIAPPLTSKPKLRPTEPVWREPLMRMVNHEWGFEQYHVQPLFASYRRHPYSEHTFREDPPILNLTSPPYSWEPISGALLSRSAVYRGAALFRDWVIDSPFFGRAITGWAVQDPILPHIRRNLSDYTFDGSSRMSVAITHEWGFEETDAAPLMAAYKRHPYSEMVWKVDPIQTAVVAALVGSGWESVSLPLKMMGQPARAGAMLRDFPIDGEFFPTVRFGWQPTLPDLFPHHPRSQAAGYDPPGVIIPPTLHEWGFDLMQASPLRSPGFRSRYSELPFRQSDPISVYPQIDLAWGFESTPANPLRNWFTRSGALVHGVDIEEVFEQGVPFGWFIQSYQPPAQNRHRQSAIFAGAPGIDGIFNRFFPFGWPIQHPQPPYPRQYRGGAFMPLGFGTEGKYVPPAAAALISWVPNNETQLLRPRAGGWRHILASMGGPDISGVSYPTPSGGNIPQSLFIANLGRFMNRGTR